MRIRDAVRDDHVRATARRAQPPSVDECAPRSTVNLVVTHDPHPLSLEGMVLSYAQALAAIQEGTLQPGTWLAAQDGSGKFIVTTTHELYQFQLRTKWHVPMLVNEGAST